MEALKRNRDIHPCPDMMNNVHGNIHRDISYVTECRVHSRHRDPTCICPPVFPVGHLSGHLSILQAATQHLSIGLVCIHTSPSIIIFFVVLVS